MVNVTHGNGQIKEEEKNIETIMFCCKIELDREVESFGNFSPEEKIF